MKTFLKSASCLSVALVAALTAGTGAAQEAPSAGASAAIRTASATRVEVGPTVDGRLDEAVWSQATALGGFVQHEPVEGAPVSERTEVRIVFDAEALYVGASLFDREPERILVGERRRDASLADADAFLMVLDTYRDQQTGFAFGTNP